MKRKILGILLGFLGLITLIISYFKRQELNTPIYSYNSYKESDYQVLLYPNSFYEDSILEAGKLYASSSVSKYKIDFDYEFQESLNLDVNYYYTITANLIGTVNDLESGEIWTRNFVLKTSKPRKINGNININEEVLLDYPYYNLLATSFEKAYDLDIDCLLKVRLDVFLEIDTKKINKSKEKINDYIEMDITLTDKVTKVSKNNEKGLVKEIKSNKNVILGYLLGTSLIIISVIIITYSYKKEHKKDAYVKMLKHILKEYQDLIITVTNEPDIRKLKVMNLITFDDLVDISEQNNVNIIYYEALKNKESRFYIILNDYVYMYIIKEEV